MANEIGISFASGSTLYACRFKANGEVFITDGSASEVWGSSGHDADDYDVSLSESGSSGHFVGDFDASDNIADGVYKVVVYLQEGANPADDETPLYQGVINWKSDNALTRKDIDDKLDDIIGADGDSLETLSDQIDDIGTDTDTIITNQQLVYVSEDVRIIR